MAWNRANQYADKLFDALDALQEAGGLDAAAKAGGWSPKARKKAEDSLAGARVAIEGQLRQLKAGSKARRT